MPHAILVLPVTLNDVNHQCVESIVMIVNELKIEVQLNNKW